MKTINADCLDTMREMPDASVTAIVTDPPYALEFMGKGWDKVLPSIDIWRECLRVLKPGGVLLSFGGTRTFHRLTCSIEDAGFQIRDCLLWLYGSGFPKSLDISKAIDKAARGVPQSGKDHTSANHGKYKGGCSETNPNGRGFGAGPGQFMKEAGTKGERILVTEAQTWNGYGTALKPAWEPIVLAMKPTDGTFAANALEHGVAGINVDACRIPGEVPKTTQGASSRIYGGGKGLFPDGLQESQPHSGGRWPANIVHDGSDDVLDTFPDAPGQSASRFFYCAKASKKDRGEGNTHPTVKPLALMQWLVRMVKMPTDTVILDPFMGSGTTGVACAAEGVDFIGIERNADYCEIARNRL